MLVFTGFLPTVSADNSQNQSISETSGTAQLIPLRSDISVSPEPANSTAEVKTSRSAMVGPVISPERYFLRAC